MNTVAINLWEDVLSILKLQMNHESYDLWLRPIVPSALDSNRLVLQVPNAFFADWLRDHYQTRIEELLKERAGDTITLSFQVIGTTHTPVAPEAPVMMARPAPALPPGPVLES